MAAFAAAVTLGYRYLETDVHATADGVALAFHDDRLDRVTDGRGVVAGLPWSTVRGARVGGREPIVRLGDLLEAWPDARLNLDPKHDAAVPPLVDAIRRHGALDRVCVGSFSMRRLARIRAALGPGLCTSLGPPEVLAIRFAAWRVPGAAWLAIRGGGACLQVPVRDRGLLIVDRATVTTAHRLGLPVHVWTVDDAAEMDRLLDLGVDGIMSDRPLVLREVLVRRGAWHDPPVARPVG